MWIPLDVTRASTTSHPSTWYLQTVWAQRPQHTLTLEPGFSCSSPLRTQLHPPGLLLGEQVLVPRVPRKLERELRACGLHKHGLQVSVPWVGTQHRHDSHSRGAEGDHVTLSVHGSTGCSCRGQVSASDSTALSSSPLKGAHLPCIFPVARQHLPSAGDPRAGHECEHGAAFGLCSFLCLRGSH